MINTEVENLLNECKNDLNQVNQIIQSIGTGSNIVPYLNNYAIIKACGTMEVAFKSIIADYCCKRSKHQVKKYLTHKLRNNSINPSYSQICGTLKYFDDSWKDNFIQGIDAHIDRDIIKTSIGSLVAARNSFAHGGNPSVSISDTIEYFNKFREAIEILDVVINE